MEWWSCPVEAQLSTAEGRRSMESEVLHKLCATFPTELGKKEEAGEDSLE